MKVTFFLLSFVVHLLILTVPISHPEKTAEPAFPVTLVLETTIREPQTSRAAHPPRNRAGKSARKETEQAQAEKVKTARNTHPEIAASKKTPPKPDAIVSVVENSEDHPSETARFDDVPVAVSPPSSTAATNESRPRAKEVGEQNLAAADRHLSERGAGTLAAPDQTVQRASYSYTPTPEYPDQARREGWEGTVLLAVLVDTEGRPETIVLSRSSGFSSLDTAAREAVTRWRFQPARYGRNRVQSWVEVPIVFALADTKN